MPAPQSDVSLLKRVNTYFDTLFKDDTQEIEKKLVEEEAKMTTFSNLQKASLFVWTVGMAYLIRD